MRDPWYDELAEFMKPTPPDPRFTSVYVRLADGYEFDDRARSWIVHVVTRRGWSRYEPACEHGYIEIVWVPVRYAKSAHRFCKDAARLLARPTKANVREGSAHLGA